MAQLPPQDHLNFVWQGGARQLLQPNGRPRNGSNGDRRSAHYAAGDAPPHGQGWRRRLAARPALGRLLPALLLAATLAFFSGAALHHTRLERQLASADAGGGTGSGFDGLFWGARRPTSYCASCKFQAVYGNHSRIPFRLNGTCGRQLLVLGLHNSGTSMVARLLTLAGVWAGRPDQLAIGKHNKLKWWERTDVYHLNDQLTAHHTDPLHPTWIGAGFDPKLVLPSEGAAFREAASSIIHDMDQYCPWLIKDPRLCFIGSMWMELMSSPVCVIVYRHPARVALRLAHHANKGVFAKLGADAWLSVWERMMTSALKTCRGSPTVIVQTLLTSPENLGTFYDVILAELSKVGVTSLIRPPDDVLREHYTRHYKQHHWLNETAAKQQRPHSTEGRVGGGKGDTAAARSGEGVTSRLTRKESGGVPAANVSSSRGGASRPPQAALEVGKAWPHNRNGSGWWDAFAWADSGLRAAPGRAPAPGAAPGPLAAADADADAVAAAAAAIEEEMLSKCSYQEVTPAMFSGSGKHSAHAYVDLAQAWPEDCAVKAPGSTRTLIMAFEKVLMQQYTGALRAPPRALAQAVLKAREDLLYDLSLQEAAAADAAARVAAAAVKPKASAGGWRLQGWRRHRRRRRRG